MKWDIWCEGHSATGDKSKAHLIKRRVEAPTFKKACAKILEEDHLYNEENNTYWGCQLFDNEAAARKAFG